MISVCLAAYNGEEYIREQIASILPQLSDDDELLISDDGSTDGTLDIVRSFNAPQIRLLQGPCKGIVANFNHLLENARGEYIFLSDQDDIWMPNKVETMLAALQEADCVVSDCEVVKGNLQTMDESFYHRNRTRRGRLYNLLVRNGYLGCCLAFKRCILERALPLRNDLPMHDIWIGNVAAFYYSVRFIPEKLIRFRRHRHTASPTAHRSTFSFLQKLGFRWRIIRGLWHIRKIK